ncbi:MAG: hypothetical protein WDW38_003410 [Sanguina aurantia]
MTVASLLHLCCVANRLLAENHGLTDTLLDPVDDDSSAQPSTSSRSSSPRHRHPHGRELIVYTGPFILEAFINSILTFWQGLLGAVGACVHVVLASLHPAGVSLIQAERLEALRDKIAVRYDPDSLSHQSQLRLLWAAAFPGIPCTSLKSEQWKEMGWQGTDPGTDFRGAGIHGLECLLYLSSNHQHLFQRLLLKNVGQRVEWEYPFAVAGLNLTFMLSEELDLGRAKAGGDGSATRLPSTPAGRAFMKLLVLDPEAFEELYCATFHLLDCVWLQQGASYMQFNAVMKSVRVLVEGALLGQPHSLQGFCQGLLADWV